MSNCLSAPQWQAQYIRQLAVAPPPSVALQRLLPFDAALLESRTTHPGAKFSFIACSPCQHLRLESRALVVSTPGQPDYRQTTDPIKALFTSLEGVRQQAKTAAAKWPFYGGWVGYFTHELGCRLLAVPLMEANPPARPDGCLASFGLYADVLIYNHQTSGYVLIGNDFGAGEVQVQQRLAAIENRLLTADAAFPTAPTVNAEAVNSLSTAEFTQGQLTLQQLIRDGDCFQANLTSSRAWAWRDGRPSAERLVALYRQYTEANPGAWCGYYADNDVTLLSGSPELLVNWQQQQLSMRPIAGTRPRGIDDVTDNQLAEELQNDPKERAEHTMLVDLVRNDLAAVSEPESVSVSNFAGIERYRHVMHLVSEVTSEAADGLTLEALLRSVFPGGTVTGAPKRRALVRINERERGPRGAYTGALGYVGLGGGVQFNLLIRTLVATPTHLVAHAGCGIVADSQSALEVKELEAKAQAQVSAALGHASAATDRHRCGLVTPGPVWQPGQLRQCFPAAEVLIVDFEDSFVHNLADYCRRLGAATRVVSAHLPPDEGWHQSATHLVLSPGPGRPCDFPAWRYYVAQARQAGIPVLGVCLGHQALGESAGARLSRHEETVHGRASTLVRLPAAATDALFSRWRGRYVGRYHSLIIDESGDNMVPLARLEDGTLMAVRYGDLPHWGVQFHPESMLTEDGLDLIAAFLAQGGAR